MDKKITLLFESQEMDLPISEETTLCVESNQFADEVMILSRNDDMSFAVKKIFDQVEELHKHEKILGLQIKYDNEVKLEYDREVLVNYNLNAGIDSETEILRLSFDLAAGKKE